jgi:predicted alpha/beta-fold hydrolase
MTDILAAPTRMRVAVPGQHTLDLPEFAPRAPWWGADLQTLRNFICRPRHSVPGMERRLILPLADGSGDRLVGLLNTPIETSPIEASPIEASPIETSPIETSGRPLIVLVHGLCGCERSTYMLRTATHLIGEGFSTLRLNLRGAGPTRPLCRFQYHAGRSQDLRDALAALPAEVVSHGVVLIGYSLGGSLVLKLMGEGAPAMVRAAVSVSAPIDLAATSGRMGAPRNGAYHRYILRNMKLEALAPGAELSPEERRVIETARSVYEFDDRFTARRDGHAGADPYYVANSAQRFLPKIDRPTVVLYALDDPWIPAAAYQMVDWAANRALHPVLPQYGGHIGFHGSGDDVPWHDRIIGRFLDEVSGIVEAMAGRDAGELATTQIEQPVALSLFRRKGNELQPASRRRFSPP